MRTDSLFIFLLYFPQHERLHNLSLRDSHLLREIGHSRPLLVASRRHWWPAGRRRVSRDPHLLHPFVFQSGIQTSTYCWSFDPHPNIMGASLAVGSRGLLPRWIAQPWAVASARPALAWLAWAAPEAWVQPGAAKHMFSAPLWEYRSTLKLLCDTADALDVFFAKMEFCQIG